VALFDEGAEDETADAAESVDSYFGGHGVCRRGFRFFRSGKDGKRKTHPCLASGECV
jgi:hypothetical protein